MQINKHSLQYGIQITGDNKSHNSEINIKSRKIRTPFQKKYAQGLDKDEEEITKANHLFEDVQLPIFLTEEG